MIEFQWLKVYEYLLQQVSNLNYKIDFSDKPVPLVWKKTKVFNSLVFPFSSTMIFLARINVSASAKHFPQHCLTYYASSFAEKDLK